MNSNYDISPRTSREGAERSKNHDGYLPYLNAPRGIGRGYVSGSWDEDDRRLITRLKLIFIGACIIVALQLSYVLGII
jgi:hypothetical protein